MKRFIFIIFGLFFGVQLVIAGQHTLPLDLTLGESQKIYAQLRKVKNFKVKDPYIAKSISGGEKLLKWVELINKKRIDTNKIRLSSKASQSRGIPIEKPSKYGPSTIKAALEKLQVDMPQEIVEIIYGKAPLVKNLPIADDVFIEWGRKVARLYQTGVRWTGSVKWLDYYAARKTKDIRGHYYLKNLSNLEQHLENFDNLPLKVKAQTTQSLISICVNNLISKKKCEKSLKQFQEKNDLKGFKNKYWVLAVKNWESFFKITDPRKDIIWRASSPGVMEVVFKDPRNEEIADWLKVNIEDEFKWQDANLALELKFISGRWGTAYLEFKKNITPHVSGGNKIVMDANTDIQEYSVKWTIRHEYGHILRLPDCYLEFYDKEQNLMINYQFDITDLMCSRAGSMNQRIYKELKRVYYQK